MNKFEEWKNLAVTNTGNVAIQPETKKEVKSTKPVKDKLGRSYATGKRKSSIARIWVKQGKGSVLVNSLPIKQYFCTERNVQVAIEPLKMFDLLDKFDMNCTVQGGGLSSQAGSIKNGIAKAIALFNPDLRPLLRNNGFLTRDSRVVERKKYGQHKARKKTQFSKR